MLRKTCSVFSSLILAFVLAVAGGSAMAAGHTELTWYGHAAFKIVTPQGHVLWLDPWITNPGNPDGKKDLAAINKGDFIFITHGHYDHVGNSVAIAKSTGAHLVSTSDLGRALVADVGFPAKQATGASLGNVGGTISILGGEVSVTFEPAIHGSTITVPGVNGAAPQVDAAGVAGGFVIRVKNGPIFYVTGDTAVFSDMQLIPKSDHIDVMLACIGDFYTMGPKGAALAVQYVHPRVVIPMHYGSFPVLTGTPEQFAKEIKARHLSTKLDVMKLHQTLTF